MRYVIVYRRTNNLRDDDLEINALESAGFTYLDDRAKVKPGDLVIARYSAWPFYNEFVSTVEYLGGRVINSVSQNNYIVDLQNWVLDLGDLTPVTWRRIEDIPEDECGPFILKGGENSRKGLWKTHCFASDKKEAIQVYFNLLNDSLIGKQNIYIRKFIPLHTYFYDVVGMPVTKEFRFFICDKQVVCGAYYWSSHIDQLSTVPLISEVHESFLNEVIDRIGQNPNAPRFYVVDIGIKENGQPIVIELNEGQQSGVSENDPFVLYRNLKRILEDK